MNVRHKGDGALQTIQQGWEDHTVENTDLGSSLDLEIPQDLRQKLEGG